MSTPAKEVREAKPDNQNKDQVPEQKPKADKRVVNNTKLLNKEVIDKASAQASHEASQEALRSVPKTAAGFERDFKQLKSNSEHVYKYLTNIPTATVETLFKNTEVPYEVFKAALESISEHGLGDEEAVRKSASFLVAWSKSSSFDMTLMFCEDPEKKILSQIGKQLAGAPEKTAFNKVFGSL